MSAIVDYSWYANTYKGQEADQTSFPALAAHAERVIGSMTRWQVNEDNISALPSLTQTLYKLAVCSEIDFLSINGLESLSAGAGAGYTVGKVRVDASAKAGGRLSASVSPAAVAYLEQTGLLNPAVPVVEGYPC